MKKIYFLEDDYEDLLMNTRVVGSGTESTVIEYQDYVLKILFPHFIFRYSRRKLNALAELEKLYPYMTLPLGEVYLEFHFIGYMMEHAGVSLKEYILNNSFKEEEKVNVLKSLKAAIEEMHKAGIVHGDIQFGNLMYKDGIAKVSDINNVRYKRYHDMYLNEISLELVRKYGTTPLLDIHAFNYLTYILINLNDDDLRELVSLGADSIKSFSREYYPNKYFDDKVCDEQMELLLRPTSKSDAMMKSKYLIDYLK